MSIKINFLQKKSSKERLWKTLNVIVGVSTILNVSLLGAMFAPVAVRAQEVADPSSQIAPVASSDVTPTDPNGIASIQWTTASISGMKFNDLNGNGSRDSGEPGLPGWTIYLDQNHNGAKDSGEASAVTDANGNYTIGNLASGTYRVREVAQADWTQKTTNPADIALADQQVKTGVNFGNQANTTPNPPLSQSCGLDIGLIVDTSGSVDSTEMGQMKTALKSFAGAFVGTPTVFSLTSFNTNSTLNRPFSRTPTQMAGTSPSTGDISTDIPSAGNNHTNWDSGFGRSFDSFTPDPHADKSNLIVIATDGSPNRFGYPTTDPSGLNYNTGLAPAVARANSIKTAGTRIVVVGIGEDTGDPATPAQKLAKMEAISGTNVALTPGAITTSTDVIKVADFTGIGAAVSAYAKALCGGKILVQKQFDTDGNPNTPPDITTSNSLLNGWTFDVNGTASDPAPQTTTNTGSLQFNNVLDGTGYSVLETQKAGTRLESVTCVNGTQSVGTVDLANSKVTGLIISTDETISCTFVNTYNTGSVKVSKLADTDGNNSFETSNPGTFTWSLDGSGMNVMGATVTGVATGNHAVNENTVANYHFVGWYPSGSTQYSCANPQGTALPVTVAVSTNQTTEITLCNARDTGSLKVIKHVANAGGSNANSGQWSMHVKQGANEVATSPQAGSETGTMYNVLTGSYDISETGGPAGFTASFSASCANGSISVVSGQPAVCTVTNTRDIGSITVNKKIDSNNDGTFEGGNTEANVLGFMWSLDAGATNRAMGSSATVTTLDPHSINENSVAGYHLVGWYSGTDFSCANPQGITLPTSFTVAKDGNKTITLCNARDTGILVIQKNVINPDGDPVSDAHTFTVTVTGQSNGTIAEGTDATYTNIPTGNYTVTELAEGSYTFVSYSLDTDTNAGNGAQVTVTKGQTITVLVTNKQKKVSIVVHKNVVGIDGQIDVNDNHDFTANVNAASGAIAESTDFSTLVNPGSVHVSENSDANYVLVSITPADFTVHSGDQPVNVYVVNKQLPAHITVYKDVRAWDGSDTSDGHTFMVNLNNETKVFGENALATFDVAPGTYSANETTDPNYTLQSMTPDHVTVGSNGTARIDVVNNQNKVFDWTVSKFGPATVQAGGQMTYDITWQVSQNSNTQLANITVTDPLPTHTSFVSCTDSCDHSTSTISWSIPGPFAPGQSGVVHLTVAVDNHLNPTQITNTATVCGDQQPFFPILSLNALSLAGVNPNHVCKDGLTTTNVLSSYELGVSKTDNQTTTSPDDTYAYTINWDVDGNAATTSNLVVKDTLPANTSFVSATNGGTNTAGIVTWNLGSQAVPSNGSLTVTVKVNDVVPNGTDLHNTVQICDDSQQCVNGDDHTRIVSDFDLQVIKTGDPEPANPNQDVTYTLSWSVSGNTPIDSNTLTDTLPAGVTFVSCSNTCDHSGSTISWNLGSFPTGQGNGSVTVTVHLPTPLPNGTTFVNNAELCASSNSLGDRDPVNHCDEDQFVTHVQSDFGLTVDKTDSPDPVQAGDQLTYTINWSVTGNAPVNTLVITDAVPTNTSFVSATNGGTNTAGTVTWNLGAHNPGDNGSVTLVVGVTKPLPNGTVISNTGQICATANNQNESTTQHCATSTTTTTVQSAPSLSITKTNDVIGFTNPGKTAIYTVTVTNSTVATDTAHAVVLTDVLPTGFTYTLGGGSTKNFSLGELAPGASVVTTYSTVINNSQTTGTYINTASAQGSNAPKVSATSNVEVRVPQVLGTTATPSLTIVKSVSPTTTNPGKVVTYTVTITNNGDADAKNVVLTDTLPKGLTSLDTGKSTRTWSIGTLAANHQRVINYLVKVGDNVKAGSYKNIAVVTATGLDSTQASATLTVRVPRVLGLATTGVSLRDYLIFAVGLILVTLGFTWLARGKRRDEFERV